MALFNFKKKENIINQLNKEESIPINNEENNEETEALFRYVKNSIQKTESLPNEDKSLTDLNNSNSSSLTDENNNLKKEPLLVSPDNDNNFLKDQSFNEIDNKNELIKNISIFDSNPDFVKKSNLNNNFVDEDNIYIENTNNNITNVSSEIQNNIISDILNDEELNKINKAKINNNLSVETPVSNINNNNEINNLSKITESIVKDQINNNLLAKESLNIDVKNDIELKIKKNQNDININKDIVFSDELNKAIIGGISKSDASVKIETRQSIKEEKVEKEYSKITALATTRPVEICYDLKNIYQDEPLERLDMYATDEDLDRLINSKPKMKYFDISDCSLITDYSKISKLKYLEELDLSGSAILKDLSFLNGLNKLRVLNIGNTNIESLIDFPSLPSLQVLNLKMNKIKSLEGLESCTELHDLILWGCTAIDNIDLVSNFKELRLLDIDSCNPVREISAISKLNKLMYLNLNFLRIEDLSPIKDLVNLEVFTMDFSQIAISEENLSYFKKLTKIKFLGLRNRMIKDLSYFQNMTEMLELELSGNAINDLSPLENMENIEILNISTNPSIFNLSPLHKMKKLKKFLINGTKTAPMLIDDFSILENFKNLKTFECKCNKKIKDISSIRFCAKLEEVNFSDSFSIADVTPLRFCQNLVTLQLENCTQIRELSFIKYLTNIMFINVAKTSIDRLTISNWTRLYEIIELKDGTGTLPIHEHIINSVKFRKKISKIIKKTIKN